MQELPELCRRIICIGIPVMLWAHLAVEYYNATEVHSSALAAAFLSTLIIAPFPLSPVNAASVLSNRLMPRKSEGDESFGKFQLIE